MGRAMLFVVLLMGALFARIMTTIQRRMSDLPTIVSRNMLTKQAESVSDYALRTAVRNSISLGMMAGPNSVVLWNQAFNGFNIQHCHIDSISYTFVGNSGGSGSNSYRAISYVSGNYANQTVNYRAELAFSFPLVELLDLDYSIYLEMDQPQFNPSPNWNHVIDSSDNENDALFYGDVDTRPMGQGVDGWKCASFGSGGGYIMHGGNESMQVASNFTILAYAKIRQGHPAATLVWLPPDPNDPALAANGVNFNTIRKRPSGGIWYQGGNMYFAATTVNGLNIEVSAPFTPDGKWPHNKDKWHFFAMTYNQGQVVGYINAVEVGRTQNLLYPFIKRNAVVNKGIYLGREYFGTPQSGDSFRYMYGLMDQVGLVPRTMSPGEIAAYHNLIINPATIQYIRD